ncbi:MAG: HAMP domain-containing histidine kinase [Deltaproteobacteria bacterium]|nr:HAMP domain-containing histidine kinase [Deltaproteobacteria bacterium]
MDRDSHRSEQSPTSLRRTLFVFAGVFSALFLIGTVALVASTLYLHRIAEELGASFETLRLAEEIEANLLEHHHAAKLALLHPDRAHEAEAERARQALRRNVEFARGHVQTETERRAVDELERRVALYFDEHRRQAASFSPKQDVQDVLDVLNTFDQAYERAFRPAQAFVDLLTTHARAARRHARVDEAAIVVSTVVGIALLVALGLLARSMSVRLYRPLVALCASMRQFARDHEVRAPAAGVQELREISGAFNEAADELQRQREGRLGFLAGVAHDLRNPLSAGRGVLQLVRPERPLPPEPKLRYALSIVDRSLDRLHHMIEDLLDATRVEMGQLPVRRRECDLVQITRSAAAQFSGLESGHCIKVTAPQDALPVLADPHRVDQVLSNLLSNAIKYSPDGGDIEVEVKASESAGAVSVQDHGVGIPPEDLERIFQPFQRSSFSKDAFPGVGLGLSVSRRLVEALDGRLEVESVLGRGSVFRVVLPLPNQVTELPEGDSPTTPRARQTSSPPTQAVEAID